MNAVAHANPHHEAEAEIARSEQSLVDLIGRASRLHRCNVQHEPISCLVCFSQRWQDQSPIAAR